MRVVGFLCVGTFCLAMCVAQTQQPQSTYQWQPILPADVFPELVRREARLVKQYIDKTDYEQIQRGKIAALTIAAYTLTVKGGVDKSRLDGIRNAALRLAAILGEKDKAAEAKQLVAAIESLKGVAKAEHQGLDFKSYVRNDYYLMVPYMQKEKGGDGLPKALQFSSRLRGSQEFIENLFSYLSRRPLRSKYLDGAHRELELAAWRTAVSGQMIAAYQPKRKSKKRDPVVWAKTSRQMIAHAVEMAHAARKKDGVALQKAASGILKSCVECHKVFQ